jgi:aspartyl-tRNA(Asn)/glutamyl-tRNA(Gln) amidotransferase subunit A
LHGVPIAIKDVFCTKGIRTTIGSRIFADHIPDHDAAVVEKLAAAGAVVVGKTGMHEIAYGVTSNNPHYGPVRNPWDPSRIPGGSSGGSAAAVAAGIVPMAMGSDTGGSIRLPASFCGIVGLKPTTGRVSRRGVMPLDFTLDHMGPLAACVRDAAVTLQALAGHDPLDDSSSKTPVGDYSIPDNPSIEGLRVGIPESFFDERVDPEIAASIAGVQVICERLGARLVPARLPGMPAIIAAGRVILMAEASTAMSPYIADRAKFGTDVMALLDQGRLIPATDYIQAQRLRRLYQKQFSRVWGEIDVLLTPTNPCFPAPIGQLEIEIAGQKEDVRLASTRFVRQFNVLGAPALALPCGVSKSGLPISAQIIGKPFDERTVLTVSAALEAAIGFQKCRPAISA